MTTTENLVFDVAGCIRKIEPRDASDMPIVTMVDIPDCEIVATLSIMDNNGFHTAYLNESQLRGLISLFERILNERGSGE